jgi:hypothetical protein
MGEQLVECRVDEAHELDLGHGPEAIGGHADGRADESRFRQGRIDHPFGPEPLLEPFGDAKYPPVPSHVLAEDDDPPVTLHLLAQGEVDGLDHVELRHISAPSVARPAVG